MLFSSGFMAPGEQSQEVRVMVVGETEPSQVITGC